MPRTTCVLCPIYRPHARPRQPGEPPVCGPDRRLLDRHLTDLAQLHHQLTHPAAPEVDRRTYRLAGERRRQAADPLAALGGAGPVPGRSGRPRVSGSREPPAPMPLERIDLTLPARPATRRLFARGTLGLDADQTGHLSVATVLETWVRDWRDTCWPGGRLPCNSMAALVGWLRARLHDACCRHPAIDEFAAEVYELRAAMRGVLGEVEPARETARYARTACPGCDLRGVLLRRPGDPYVECGGCGLLSTDDELAPGRRGSRPAPSPKRVNCQRGQHSET